MMNIEVLTQMFRGTSLLANVMRGGGGVRQ